MNNKIKSGDLIALKTFHGTYISANKSGSICQQKYLKEWEWFTVSELNGLYSFKTYHGNYLRAGRLNTINSTDVCKEWEYFNIIYNENGTISLKTFHNKYLRADKHDKLNQTNKIKEWEMFTVVKEYSTPFNKTDSDDKLFRNHLGYKGN